MKFMRHSRPRPHHMADNSRPLLDGVPEKDTQSLAAIVANTVPMTPLALRAQVLRRLLMPIGPLALTVLAGGAFAKYVEFARWSRISVSLEDAARITSSQIVELVGYVEQSDPTILEQVLVLLSRDATTMAALGATAAAIAVRVATHRKSVRETSHG
jgi:hypothetical protein